eukprot:gene8541-9242_t
MQYLSLKSCNGSHAPKPKNMGSTIPSPVSVVVPHHVIKSPRMPFSLIDGESFISDSSFNLEIPSIRHTLHFSTYGSSVEAERVYSSSISLDGSKFLPARRTQQYIDKSLMRSEQASVMRRFSSAKENDFRQTPEVITSSLFSLCYDENPSYQRYTSYPIPEVSSSSQ